MTADQNPATRRIMDTIGDTSRIPILNIEEGDVYVLFGFPIAGLVGASLIGIDALTLPLIMIGIAVGVAVVYASPPHLPTTTWLSDSARYYFLRPRMTYNVPRSVRSDLDAKATMNTSGGVVQYTPFRPDERTQDLTQIKRAWPGARTIERTDGSMVTMLEVDPGNMDFAMSDDWANIQSLGESFANNDLDFPLTVYTTTRSFPVEKLTTQIDKRLGDRDVSESPVFRRLLEEYRQERPKELKDTQSIQYYLGVEVAPIEVYQHTRAEPSPLERLTTFPLIGLLFIPFVTRREQLTEAQLRAQLFEELEARCRTVQTELVGKAHGWSSQRLSTVELFVLSMDFWNGEEHQYGDQRNVIRSQPAINHRRREDVDE